MFTFALDPTSYAEWPMRICRPQGVCKADRLQELLLRLPSVRCALLSHVSPDSCIAMTRIVCEWAAAWGLSARARSVRVEVHNPLGSHVLVCGSGEAEPCPRTWDGHLVAIVSDGVQRTLIDASADQFQRPHKTIHVPSVVSLRWTPLGASGTNELGTRIHYTPRANSGYQDAPDWTRRYPVTLS